MIVTVKLTISPYPRKEVERSLVYAAQKLTTDRERINVEFPENDSQDVVLQFWMADKSHYKVVGDIFEGVKRACLEFYEDIVVSFENDRKRKSRSGRRRR